MKFIDQEPEMQQGGVITPGEKLFSFKLNNIEIIKISSPNKLNTA